jgi:hypothetical protein
MLNIQRAMQVCLLVVVLISSALLSLSTNNLGLFLVALICAVGGFVVTDLLKLFRIEGWLANMVSIAILILAMKDFFVTDSSGKLMAVSNLLVYLQSVLMFQEKTPRLNWQVLVLSLLQVVITTIFSIGFSISYMLLVYFVAAAAAMVLQSIYTDSVDVAKRNRSVISTIKKANNHDRTPSSGGHDSAMPMTLFEAPGYRHKTLLRAFSQLSYWMIACLLFTSVLFLMAPRTNNPLFQPISYKVAATGFNNEVNLNETGVIRTSNKVIFTAQITDAGSQQPIRLGNVPYFRSMALSTLTIEDDQTNWRAPFDRVDDSFYRSLDKNRRRRGIKGRPVKQIITLEQTTNPMIYGVVPTHATENTPGIIEFCTEISAHVRARGDGKVSLSPFKYETGTILDSRNYTLPGWPHYGRTHPDPSLPIAADSMAHQWLTEIQRARYPQLVAAADALAGENTANGGDLGDLVKKFTDYFSGNQFKYTLDYRNVPRDTSIDSVEDFFANHRAGHCEMYASALTLMLRSQNIPARLVVGFMAKDFNELNDSYVVRGKHAHAWVEVYFHPEDCTQEMFVRGIAGPAGSWMIADPNPIATLSDSGDTTNNTIELARKVWQDIVLGMEGSETRSGRANTFFLYTYFEKAVNVGTDSIATAKSLATNSSPQTLVAGLLAILLSVLIFIRSSRIKAARSRKNLEKVGVFRRLMASAVGLISTNLQQWVLAGDHRQPSFYDSLAEILRSNDLERASNQTHREFADAAVMHFQNHDQRQVIEPIIRSTTERFYEVRFGHKTLTPSESEKIENDLRSLKATLSA